MRRHEGVVGIRENWQARAVQSAAVQQLDCFHGESKPVLLEHVLKRGQKSVF